MEFRTKSSEETEILAEKLKAHLKGGDVICLRGEMGVGKTVFTKGLCRALGVTDYVTSPTFTVVNEYDGETLRVFHFDMYRILDADELLEIGFDEYLNSGGICVIEWPQNVEKSLPKRRIEIEIKKDGANERTITVTGINREIALS